MALLCGGGNLIAMMLIGGLLMSGGCAADASTKENLQAGYSSLDSRQYDDALARADDQLNKTPRGPGSAEALYLRGRAIEQRAKSGGDQSRSDLNAARQSYVEALNQIPPASLEPYIRTSLANVCYWQDDYTTAMQQWVAAYGRTSDVDLNGFILYRIGLCQQRLGQFDVADQTFAKVQAQRPNSEVADRARNHSGYRSFTVQLATFANAGLAEAAIAQVRKMGSTPLRAVDSRGRHVISVGPAATYAQAQQLKARFSMQFPDAIIVP